MPSLARRVADFGWHIQLHMRARDLIELVAMLGNVPIRKMR
jgi:hypothetical protein